MVVLRAVFLTIGILHLSVTSTLAEGDVALGQTTFKKCVACHEATKATNKLGPHMIGIVGRKVAAIDGYKYSAAMTAFAATVPVWDEANLNAYLEKPKGIVVGTKMAFGGIAKPEERENLIAYLKTLK